MTARKCKCGCGSPVSGAGQWLSGHDHRAVHQRIRRDFSTVAEFVDWYDTHAPRKVARQRRARAAA